MHTISLESFKDLIKNHYKAYELVDCLDIEKKTKHLISRYLGRWLFGPISTINKMKKEEYEEAVRFLNEHKKIILKPFTNKTKIAYFVYKILGLKFVLKCFKLIHI